MRFDPAQWSAIYEPAARSGHAFVFSHGAAVAREACIARAKPGEQWLDVGAGPGHLAAELAAAGLGVTAVDSDPSMVEAARARVGDTVEVALAEADRLPFPDEAFDGVVATSLVGLLPEPEPFLAEVRRLLRPGGSAVITFTRRCRAQRLADLGPYAASSRRYTRAEVVRALAKAGLVPEHAAYFNLFVARGRRMWPPRRPALLLERHLRRPAGPLLARNLLAVATRGP